jgi:hypothetical protein
MGELHLDIYVERMRREYKVGQGSRAAHGSRLFVLEMDEHRLGDLAAGQLSGCTQQCAVPTLLVETSSVECMGGC